MATDGISRQRRAAIAVAQVTALELDGIEWQAGYAAGRVSGLTFAAGQCEAGKEPHAMIVAELGIARSLANLDARRLEEAKDRAANAVAHLTKDIEK